ncbi:DUF3857 and transglutaminase domain-containing protein [Flavihumibacter rivuli]|uniref:DUF3857 and transglutaminase domain-containing protein n=1 Tax=Flavihumibacter rivuli TaxID=2838156 RepID=UPI001BDEC586|nr:DUF3857 and transglutaminase domain-containing protein [Flavihumibacter rivuli]ULQ57351.1 DUF3857 and transglutaminase domain-containing protein [Flavihumibacter rivuli]
MKKLTLPVLACLLQLLTLNVFAQDKSPVKFGKISPEDFNQGVPAFDSGAHAVVIADIGNSYIVGTNKGDFGFNFERKVRIKILDKNGLDAATFSIPYYHSTNSSDEEKINYIRAYTYNLENGKVVETKLEGSQIFTDKLSRNWNIKKFTLPAVKEGSIIELSYSITSDYIFNLRAWTFQDDHPVLWSEYVVEIPDFLHYVYLTQGYHPFHINKSEVSSGIYTVRESGYSSNSTKFNAKVDKRRWVMKDIPSLREEPFTTSVNNHKSRVELQLSAYNFPGYYKDVMGNWTSVSESLMKEEQFGAPVERVNGWLNDDLKAIVGNTTNKKEIAQKIYAFVRDNFTCTSTAGMYLDKDLKTIFKNKSGSVADINLLLTAMLKNQGLEAYPIILSTRSNGVTHEVYPLMDRFNYVISCVLLEDGDYFLDASVPDLAFGMVPKKCYNGHARVIMKEAIPVYFNPDSTLERKVVMATVIANEKGELEGAIQNTLGMFETVDLRENIREKGEQQFFEKIRTELGSDYQVKNMGLDSLKILDKPVKVHYEFVRKTDGEDLLYIDPVFVEAYKENPFKSAMRQYPIEMPYRYDETYILSMEVPAGYVVDELPKSTRVALNEDEGMFEYLIGANEGRIQLRSRVVLYKARYNAADYQGLRDFFGMIVKKHSEQIVLKKAKP